MLNWWLSYRCHMKTTVNVIWHWYNNQSKENLLILKIKTHRFHTTNTFYRNISLQKIAQIFYSGANRILKFIIRNVSISGYVFFRVFFLNSLIVKPEVVTLSKMCCFNPWFFKKNFTYKICSAVPKFLINQLCRF